MTTSIPSTATHIGNSDVTLQSSNETRLPAPSIRVRYSGCGFSAILRLLSSTWRADCEGLEILDELAQSQHRHILVFWHRHYITLFRLFRNRPTIAVTNQSHRGQVIANICQRNGMRTLQVRGKGTKHMLALLDSAADHGLGLAIAVDGPLGPACEVKRVVLHLAVRLNCPIVPVSVAAGCKHVFASRWDRLEIPHLFSRVSFVIGTPMSVSPMSSRAELREMAFQLKNTIERGAALARQRL